MKTLLILWGTLLTSSAFSQTGRVEGTVTSSGRAVKFSTIRIPKFRIIKPADSSGFFRIDSIKPGVHELHISALGYDKQNAMVEIREDSTTYVSIDLREKSNSLNEVVITGTMKEISRLESPVPVEVYTSRFFCKNPTPSMFDAIGLVNGVQPQLNCNICNTGDIHINGMEGAYTMILIDGMPIVSSLSSVYGLSGIPNSMVERIEVVKGPGSALYGSEAMGGIVNVITKSPSKAPVFSADLFTTSWQEHNGDLALKLNAGKSESLLGINYFYYQNRIDKNNDHFTDLTLQNRISVFNKWGFKRKAGRAASVALRYVYENRWGGEMNWDKQWRGTDTIYGESILTKRWEVIGSYQLPVKEKIMVQMSYNWHQQDSYYGESPFLAKQKVSFAQLYWDKQFGDKHNFLLGAALRNTYYDDNTPGTASASTEYINAPSRTPLPGIFIQDEWKIDDKNTLLAGYRLDYDKHHGAVHSPRIAYKWSPDQTNTIRASLGTGFRVVNLFTEDHAALTGAREVIIAEALLPERSYNGTVNYNTTISPGGSVIVLDISGFYSYFTNKINGDFDSDPSKIIYANLKGHAVSRGITVNTDLSFRSPLKINAGITFMDVFQQEAGAAGRSYRSVQLHAPRWSGTAVLSYTLGKGFSTDFTSYWKGPMRLPVFPNDYRPEYSPWYVIANFQLTKKFDRGFELYGGIKNIFDFVPRNPLLRPFDPFNKQVNDPVANPHGYAFDTSYNYSSLQGARSFIGFRYNLAN